MKSLAATGLTLSIILLSQGKSLAEPNISGRWITHEGSAPLHLNISVDSDGRIRGGATGSYRGYELWVTSWRPINYKRNVSGIQAGDRVRMKFEMILNPDTKLPGMLMKAMLLAQYDMDLNTVGTEKLLGTMHVDNYDFITGRQYLSQDYDVVVTRVGTATKR